MSDEDDQSLIDDLEALSNVVASHPQNDLKDQRSRISHESSNSLKLELFSQKSQDETDDSMDDEENLIINDIDDSYADYSCKDLQDLYELNKKLIESFLKARDKVVALQKECKKNQRIVEEQISKHNSHWHAKIITFNAGMPYFKDKNYFAPKRNSDLETKIKNGELRLGELQRIHRWTLQDKSNLLKAIRHEVLLRKNIKKIEPEEAYTDNTITKASQLPSDVKKAIGPLGSMKFDWLKIANNISENKHSAEECEVMWNVFLHPDINKQKWTSKEDKALNRIAEEYEAEDWDSIASELNTKRSGYQCFVRYNTNNWKNLMKGQSWTPNDDKILLYLVNKLRIGDFIPWGYISSCMNYWTKQQVYFRWIYSLAPNLKKGRFSEEENKKLLDAVKKYGQNFSKIAALVMNNSRTNTQLKEHYQTLASKTNHKKVWSLEEDELLIQLHEKYGTSWSKIVHEMPSADITRVTARQRFQSLLRYQEKGIHLQNISREENKEDPFATHTITYTTNSPWSQENKEIHVKHLKIDEQLINFFKKENASQSSILEQKSYPLSKLKEDTEKLYQILGKFNANLDLPEFDDECDLSESQLQLLSSLKDHLEEKKINMTEKIETVRMQMFGPQEPLPSENRFVPPLPFGFCFPKYTSFKRKKFVPIDYTSDFNEYHQVKVPSEFEPDRFVSNYLGEEIENQFEKFKKLMAKWTEKSKRVYSLKCRPFANSNFFDEIQRTDGNRVYAPSPVVQEMKYSWDLNKMVPINSTEEKVDLNVEGVPALILSPSRTTLQAYQTLLLSSGGFPAELSETDSEDKLSSRGREALYNLKRRYQQLFHMPTGLSRMIPPDIVDASAFLPALEKLKKNMKKKRPKRLN